MSDTHLKQLTRILAAFELRDATAYQFAGTTISVATSAGPVPNGQDPLVASLQNTLYQHAYSHSFTGGVKEIQTSPSSGDDLTVPLSKANSSRDRWSSGWSVLHILPTGQIAAKCQNIIRLLWPGEYIAQDAAGAPKPGTRLSLYWKREATVLQPGFYFAFGEMVPDHSDETRVVRFYWHVKAGAAPSLLSAVSNTFNRYQVPFRFKFLNRSEFYGRSDAAVLYTARRHFRIASELLAPLYADLCGGLEADTPLFTKVLAPGLSLAEDPGNGESFGMNRCRLLAEAIVDAFRAGQQTVEARLQATERRFQDAGFTLTAPHLNPGSNDSYLWPNN